MKNGKAALAVIVAGLWITLSEFVRNELLFKSYWTEHYASLGLTWPSDPVNGMLWLVWSLVFAGALFWISRKFSFFQTFMLGWLVGFVLMWLVIGNMQVLPMGILTYAIPLSLLEVLIAVLILTKMAPAQKAK
ncbi:hypothetical protein KQI65_13960 [bacterium]|nr:hypothetical protein [bacterium]